MDPVTIVVAALAAGAGKALEDGVKDDVAAAYTALRNRVKALFARKPSAELVLAEHEHDPDTWHAPLTKELQQADLTAHNPTVNAAQALLALLDAAGTRAGKYHVDLRGAKAYKSGTRTPKPTPLPAQNPDDARRRG